MSDKDTVFQHPEFQKEGFAFDAQVVRVFDDMITRSVPCYEMLQKAIAGLLSDRPISRCYDLGCSTGTTFSYLTYSLKQPAVLIGVDASPDMLEKATQKSKAWAPHPHTLIFEQKDLNQRQSWLPCQAVIVNLVLQFIRPESRLELLASVYDALQPGGVLIVVEKTIPNHPQWRELFVTHYHRFKFDNGYSLEEIDRKKKSLEEVLVPWTLAQNEAAIHDAGFESIETFFQWMMFVGWVAVKPVYT